MIRDTTLRRLIHVGTGLVIFVVCCLAIVVIPFVITDTTPDSTPEQAVPAFWIVIIVHLFVIAILTWASFVDKRGGHINKGIMIVAGVAAIILGLMLLDAAVAYFREGLKWLSQGMLGIAILLFICVGFDVITGVMMLVVRRKLLNQARQMT
nr:hypothetical protein [Candidatus Sigynarchaeota archaeon]